MMRFKSVKSAPNLSTLSPKETIELTQDTEGQSPVGDEGVLVDTEETLRRRIQELEKKLSEKESEAKNLITIITGDAQAAAKARTEAAEAKSALEVEIADHQYTKGTINGLRNELEVIKHYGLDVSILLQENMEQFQLGMQQIQKDFEQLQAELKLSQQAERERKAELSLAQRQISDVKAAATEAQAKYEAKHEVEQEETVTALRRVAVEVQARVEAETQARLAEAQAVANARAQAEAQAEALRAQAAAAEAQVEATQGRAATTLAQNKNQQLQEELKAAQAAAQQDKRRLIRRDATINSQLQTINTLRQQKESSFEEVLRQQRENAVLADRNRQLEAKLKKAEKAGALLRSSHNGITSAMREKPKSPTQNVEEASSGPQQALPSATPSPKKPPKGRLSQTGNEGNISVTTFNTFRPLRHGHVKPSKPAVVSESTNTLSVALNQKVGSDWTLVRRKGRG